MIQNYIMVNIKQKNNKVLSYDDLLDIGDVRVMSKVKERVIQQMSPIEQKLIGQRQP
jgi:hypothetical protein